MSRINPEGLELSETVVAINRVAKVVKGGKRFSFSVLVVVGDKKGHVGMSIGKAKEIQSAIHKAVARAKKDLITVPLHGVTIPHSIIGVFGAAKVLLKPAAPGTGVIAGGQRSIRSGRGRRERYFDEVSGFVNPYNVVYATMEALQALRTKDQVSALRSKDMVTSNAS